ncbi:hypothetical protein AMTR_s00004p00208750, partial [Amborella trichopoda]
MISDSALRSLYPLDYWDLTSQDSLYRRRQIHTPLISRACFARMFLPLPKRQLALPSLPPLPIPMLLFPPL